MERKSKKITAFLLAFLMILSVCLPSAGSLGLNRVNAEADAGYEESADMDLSNATGGDASTEAAQDPTEEEYITTGNALSGMPAPIANENTPMPIMLEDNGLTVDDFKLKHNGQDITKDTIVKNGDNITAEFDWSIKNNSHIKDFWVDLGAENLNISDFPLSDLKDENQIVVGQWEIKDGKVHFVLKDEFVQQSEIKGWVTLDGTVDADKGTGEDRQDKEFSIGGDTFHATVDYSDTAYLTLTKAADGSAVLDETDGKLYQKFKLSLYNWNNDNASITVNGLQENPVGMDVSGIRNITVVMSDGTEEKVSSWEELQKKLENQELEANKTITITYEMPVTDAKDALKQKPDNPPINNIEVDYTNNKGEDLKANGSAAPNISKPSILKAGSVVKESNGDVYVEWTITVNPGMLDWNNLDFVKDSLDANLTLLDGSTLDLNNLKDQFQNKDGVYTLTYRTKVSPDLLGSPFGHSVNNKVEMQFTVNKDVFVYDASADVGIDPEPLIFKKGLEYDQKTNVLKWQIDFKVPETGIMENVIFSDTPDYHQSLLLNVTVDGVSVMENGTILPGVDNILDSTMPSWEGHFKLQDQYVAEHKGETIVITIETQLKPEELLNLPLTVKNTMTVKFTYDGESTQQSADGEFEIEKSLETLMKSGKESTDFRNAIDYSLELDLSLLDVKENDIFSIKDVLPEHMHLVGTPKISTKFHYTNYDSSSDSVVPGFDYSSDESGKNLSFSVTMSDDYLNSAATWNANSYNVVITYSAQVDKDFIAEWIEEGKRVFHNEAELFQDGISVGTAEADVPLEYKGLVTKNGSYPSDATEITYSVVVNPDAIDLVPDSDFIVGTDESGDALILENGSIKIYEYTGTGNPQTDTANWVECNSARYTYNQKLHTITFILPDSKTLKIEYEMLINLHKGRDNNNDYLTQQNSFNTFSLSGYTEDIQSSSKAWNEMVHTGRAGTEALTGTITIYKYWTDNGQMKALNGSKFELYKCEYNTSEVTNSQFEKVHQENLEIVNDDGILQVTGLPYDNVYALFEVDAKTGFLVNENPYYFVLTMDKSSETTNKYPSNVDLYFSGGYIYYENFPSQAKLVLKKTIAGDTSVDDLEALENAALDITFTVKDSDDQVVGEPHKLSEFKKNSGGYELELDVAPGTYTVEETKTTITGYKLESTSYTITTQSTGSTAVTTDTETSAKTGDITIKDGDTVTAAFTNTYSKEETTGTLVLKKTIKGSVTKDEAEGALKFTVESKDGTFSETYTLDEDFIYDETTKEYTLTLDNLSAGEYTVTESVTDITGHVLESVTYSVDGETAVSGKEASAEVTAGGSIEVAFEDDYRNAVGTLVIEKTISGELTSDELDAVKDSIVFTVTDPSDNTKEYTLDKFTYDTSAKKYTLKLENQALGTYTVTETAKDITGKVLQTTYSVDNSKPKNGKEAETTFDKDGSESTVAFRNNYTDEDNTGTLVLKKTIKGSVTKDEAEGALKFTVESKDGTFSETYTLDEDFIYDETTKEYTLTLDNLSAGEYTVTESVTDITGHVLESVTYSVDGETAVSGKEASAEVTAGGSIEVAFEDDYRNAVGTLVIEKTISGELTSDELDAVKDSIVFTVTDPSDNTKEYTLDKFTYDTSAKKYTLKLENQALGTYTVTETAKDITGKVLQTTYSVDSSTFEAGKKAETELEKDGSESTVAFQNKYIDEENAGKLIIQKKIEGSVTDEEAKGALQFTVESKDGTFSETYTLDKDFDYNSETGIFTKELDVVAGEYTVTESVRDVDGHVLKSVSYTVSGSSAETKTDPGSVGVTVQKKGEVTVKFKDDYKKATGTLVLKKTIKGEITKEEAEGALEFTVKNNTTKEEKKYTLKDFTYDDKTGEFTLTLPLEEGGYTVTESTKDVDGYVLDSVTYSVNGGDATKGDSVTTDVKAKETVTVAFEDDYSKSKTESSSEQVTETTTETTIITTENVTETETQTSAKSEVKTGDKAPIILVCILLLVSAAAGGIVIGKKMKNKKDQ